ncbi:VOC family protein [Croceicoccus sp. Ery5]|uniref:VOC family protein n=1 Tax=Croceicoccus sp. Ery5 TaxID=1703340 RepID=UPI001E5D73A3|nr:VOC family protein [Croceicoccus sp. Ery5]
MGNRHGEPVWYELMCRDLSVTEPFYAAVVGWNFVDTGMDNAPGYRFIRHGAGDYDAMGGALALTDEMLAGGARPMWAVYFAVEDVDATVAAITARGGSVLMPAFDLEHVGRMAFVADPQGNPFYVMRGFSDMESRVFGETGEDTGLCGWNELITPDVEPTLGFYRDILRFDTEERMPMGPELGDYVFLKTGESMIGAAMMKTPDSPAGWRFYFRIADIEAGKAAVEANGGTVVFGPMEVPGDEMIIIALDPEGTIFGLVAPKKD